MYKIKTPKILFLALDIASFYKRSYYNTNDLAELANKYKKDLVRQRVDKKDYKYLGDTNFGGLRGNFSTLLTWKGFVKRGATIVNYCSVGRDGRLVNAVCNGEIILDRKDLTANTNDRKLKKLLEIESWLFYVRETQAHIKNMLKNNPEIPLFRDNANFPKESVVISKNGQYFIRALVNNFVDINNTILEYSIINLWEGKKFKKKNMHLMIVLPTISNPWEEIYFIKNEELYKIKPLLLRIDLADRVCFDENGNRYSLYSLDTAINEFSTGDENIQERLNYNWKKLRDSRCKEESSLKEPREDEFSVFLKKFLNWKKEFSVGDKKIVDVLVSSSSGPDVNLKLSGGTIQRLELEHSWKSYLDHGHYKDNAWSNSWLFSEEEFDKIKILKLFSGLNKIHHDRIPNIFLCLEGDKRKAYMADWKVV